MMKLPTSFFAFLGAIMLAHPVWAISAKDVSNALKRTDDRFSVHQFQAKEFLNGRFITNWKSVAAAGKYRIETTIRNSSGSSSSPYTILFDGEDEFATVGNSMTITRGSSKGDSELNRAISLQPTASFFKGRGLSILRDLRVKSVPNSVLIAVEGHTPNGYQVRAVVDPTQQYLARRIERLNKGKPFVVIQTQGALANGLVPRTSQVNVIGINRVQRFEFQSATVGQKPQDKFQFLVDKPMIIADARFGPAIVIKKTTLKPMSKADIFAITDKQNAKLNALKEQEYALENGQRKMNMALSLGPLAAAALLLGWRSKKRVQPTS